MNSMFWYIKIIYLNFLVTIDFLFRLNNRKTTELENCDEIFIKYLYININCLEKMPFNWKMMRIYLFFEEIDY